MVFFPRLVFGGRGQMTPRQARSYECVPDMLKTFGVSSIRLMTNNPYKINSLKALGVDITGTIAALSNNLGERAAKYLATKQVGGAPQRPPPPPPPRLD